MKKSENGITLVALVVTIIILLIISGVGITALTQTGLLEKTKEAKEITEKAQQKVIDKINNLEKQIEGTREQITVDKTEYEQLKADVASLKNNQSTVTTGTYMGTGTYGINNPCKINFEKAPQIVLISTIDEDEYTSSCGLVFIQGCKNSTISVWAQKNASGVLRQSIVNWNNNGKQLEWYCNNDTSHQLNSKDKEYKYIAIY